MAIPGIFSILLHQLSDMKTFGVVNLINVCFQLPVHCQSGDEREMVKGTVLNYTVKDGAVTYKLRATIMVWNPELPVQVQWQTSGAKGHERAVHFSA